MKRLYWRPRSVSRNVLLLLALLAIFGFVAVEYFKVNAQQPYYQEKLNATVLAKNCMETIKQKRLTLGHEIDYDLDPADSGMIGALMTPVTTVAGHLGAKQTSVNPNWAAVLVDMLRRAGVKEGDLVAVGCSGSFPALNTAVYSALATIKARPVIIASAGASQFGANFPDLLWIDMERLLYEEGLIPFKSIACSIGGYEDLGLGMTEEARRLIIESIRNKDGLTLISADTPNAAIEERMDIYDEHAHGGKFRAYINVGGGTISVGGQLGKRKYRPGLNLSAPFGATRIDSIMTRFMNEGAPVIHLTQIEELALDYELPIASEVSIAPGEGNVFYKRTYNRWLALAVLLAILASLRAVVLTDIGSRLMKGRARKDPGQPEPMV